VYLDVQERRKNMAQEGQARGSEKLFANLAKKGTAATVEDVKAAVSLPATADYKLMRWLIRGIPPVYYEVETLFQVKPAQLGEFVNHFAAQAGIRGVNILTNGIPVFDVAEVNVTIARGGEV
jgi:hypothetical protein